MNLELWKKVKKEKKFTIEQIAQKANLPKGSVQNIFCGYVPNPRSDTVEAIEKALGIERSFNEDELRIQAIGGYDLLSQEKSIIPLVGQVVAGKPIESPEYLEGYVYVSYKNPDEYFALKVKGDSMINAGITERSILIVHKQNCAENGDIIIASIDGESTVKRYREDKGAVFLVPENPNYSPIFVSPESNFYIFGKVVQIRTDL